MNNAPVSTGKQLAPGIFDNHVLRLWHDWQALRTQNPTLATEWRYERDESGVQLAGPGECLSRTMGNVRLQVILGGDGLYTPLAEMEDRHGVVVSGPGRVVTSVSPARGRELLVALAEAEEAFDKIGKPYPARKHKRKET